MLFYFVNKILTIYLKKLKKYDILPSPFEIGYTLEKKMQQSYTKLTLLGGNNRARIGASSNLIEHINEKGQKTRILIDLGVLFPNGDFSNSVFVPDVIKYLGYNPIKNQTNQALKAYHSMKGGKKTPQIDALLLTHMHEDHIGGIVNLLKAGFIFPSIYASKETLLVLGRILVEEGVPEMPEMYPINKSFQISKDMVVTPFPVSHTTVGSLGYHILTKFNNQNHVGLMHMGDFNLSDVLIGKGYQQDEFNTLLNSLYVTHVLTDSTSVSNKQNQELTFKETTNNWSQLMKENNKRILSAVISRSTQNMAPILTAAKQTGRKVFIDGFMQRLVYDEMQKAGVLDDFEGTVFNHRNIQEANLSDFITSFSPQKQVIIFSGAFAEGLHSNSDMLSGLVRVAKKSHKSFLLDSTSLIALSQRAIPVDDIHKNMKEMSLLLAEQNKGQLIQNQTSDALSLGEYPMLPLQRTGHATFKETILILNSIKHHRSNFEDNLTIIPVHGDDNQLKSTAKCAKIIKANHITTLNGTDILLSPDGFTSLTLQNHPQQWLGFKNDTFFKDTAFSIDLVQENQVSAQKVEYKKIFNLGGGTLQISANKNKLALLNYMRAALDRRVKN